MKYLIFTKTEESKEVLVSSWEAESGFREDTVTYISSSDVHYAPDIEDVKSIYRDYYTTGSDNQHARFGKELDQFIESDDIDEIWNIDEYNQYITFKVVKLG